MQPRPDWAPETIDVEQPSAARIYDYLLGGSHNFAADREFARQAIAIMPAAATNQVHHGLGLPSCRAL